MNVLDLSQIMRKCNDTENRSAHKCTLISFSVSKNYVAYIQHCIVDIYKGLL